MRKKRTWCWVACALLAAAGFSRVGAHPPVTLAADARPRVALPADARQRVALLIGIDHYARDPSGHGPPDLAGAANDVKSVRELLLNRFGFAAEDVCTLIDEQATHAAIVAAYHDALIERSGPGTEALFWFSGHGSRCDDLSGAAGAEAGGKDSTLLAYDSRARADGTCFDVTDDELHSLLCVLTKRTSRVTVVTDSCYSGGVMRGAPSLPVRFAEPASRPPRPEDLAPFWPKDVPLLDDDVQRGLAPLHYVHFAACANDESAHEHAIDLVNGDRLVHGAFTFFFSDALQRMAPGTTWEQLARAVGVRLSAEYRGQQSQAEGGDGDLQRVAFEGRFAAPLPGFDARVAPKRTTVEVGAGWMQLLREGSVLEIRDLEGRAIGRARVRAARPTSSVAEWIGAPPAIDAPAAARAIELERGSEPLPLRLRVAPDPATESIAAALASSPRPRLELVRDPTLAAPLELARGAGDDSLELRALPEGFTIARFEGAAAAARGAAARGADGGGGDDGDVASRLEEQLAREARFRGLLDLSGASGSIGLSVALERPLVSDSKPLPVNGVPAEVERGGGGGDSLGVGAWRVRVPADRTVKPIVDVRVELDRGRKSPVHIAILCVSEDRSVVQLYPAEQGVRDNELAPGETLTWPIRVFETPIEGLGRPARDRILVLATLRPADFSSFLQQPALAEPPATRGGGDRLPDALLDAFAPCRTRGATGVAAGGEEAFGVAALDMVVVTARE